MIATLKQKPLKRRVRNLIPHEKSREVEKFYSNNLGELIRQSKRSPKEIADAVGISVSRLYDLRRDPMISMPMALRFCRAFGWKLDEIIKER